MRTLERPALVRACATLGTTSATQLSPAPFGLEQIDLAPELGADVLRVLWPSSAELETAAALVGALVDARALPGGTLVAVLDHGRRDAGLLARLLPRRRVAPELACAALLARGYVDLRDGVCPTGSGVLALGRAPSARP